MLPRKPNSYSGLRRTGKPRIRAANLYSVPCKPECFDFLRVEEVKRRLEITTRSGSGALIKMTKEQISAEMEAGSNDAAEKAHIPGLTGDEFDHILEIITEPSKVVSVERGREIVLTRDGGVLKYTGHMLCAGAILSKEQGVSVGERIIGLDTMELGHADYSFKPCKAIAFDEAQHMENAQMVSIIPLFYGAMPNLGTYYRTLGGSWPAPTDLLKEGKIKESRETQEHAAADLKRDIIYLAKIMDQSGSDGLNLDTTAAAGDAEFYATLNAVEQVKKGTNLAVEVGMATEMILGMHCELEYQGTLLAGLWPHQQGKLIEKAGASIFGPVVNTKTTKSFPWNLARAVTFIKAVTKSAQIPVHCNMGTGVCGVPMTEIPPVDAVTRAAKAMVEITDIDGI
jgi:dimethylamine--corrinoid protein Co-methyltransferase